MAWLSGYNNRIKLTIDQTKVDADLTDFPVTHFLTSGRFDFVDVDPAGLSLIMTASDGITLQHHDRERFDYSNSLGEIHTRLSAVAGAIDTEYYMYWKTVETARWEQFLDKVHIDSESGVTWSVNRPTKYGSNPIFGNAAWTWDRNFSYATIITRSEWPAESRYRMWYTSANATLTEFVSCYAYSADGISWTRPLNLGQVTYGGNTNNNILAIVSDRLQDGLATVVYDDVNALYVLQANTVNNGAGGVLSANDIYTSSNPTGPWTLQKSLPCWSDDSQHPGHGMGLVKRQDGRWIAYYQGFLTGVGRSIGAYISDTTSLSGAWTDCGIIDPSLSTTAQKHSQTINTWCGGLLNSAITTITTFPEYLTNIIFAVSRSGLDTMEKDTAWISRGSAGNWDDVQVIENTLLKVGNEWWIYYAGQADTANPYNRYVGLAKIGYMRIGQVAKTSAGEAYIITKPIDLTSVPLYVNAVANGASDKIEVELLDASDNSVITNYAKTDCIDITGDVTAQEVMWGTNHIYNCPTKRVKIKFYLNKTTNDVKLYSYTIGAESDCLQDNASIQAVWDDNFDAVYHNNDDILKGDSKTSFIKNYKIPSARLNPSKIYTGTKKGANEPIESAGQIGKSQLHDGIDDYTSFSTELGNFGTANFTVEMVAKRGGNTANFRLHKFSNVVGNNGWYIQITATGADFVTESSGVFKLSSWIGIPGTNWYYVAGKRASGIGYLRVNEAQQDTDNWDHNITATVGMRLGHLLYNAVDYYYHGYGDEIRISNIARADAWLKTTYYSLFDTLLTYGGEETPITGGYYYQELIRRRAA